MAPGALRAAPAASHPDPGSPLSTPESSSVGKIGSARFGRGRARRAARSAGRRGSALVTGGDGSTFSALRQGGATRPPVIRLDQISKQHGKQILFLEAS